jgi:hypothetical protein
MEVLYEHCIGCPSGDTRGPCAAARGAPVDQRARTFGTTTGELGALVDWLMREGVTHVAMESTGVYWKPVYCDRLASERLTRHYVHRLERLALRPGRIRGRFLGNPGIHPRRFCNE